jgi:hypothetical protein
MVKKYYQPYEQMYKRVDLRTGEVIESPASEELQQENAVISPREESYITPQRTQERYQTRPFFQEDPPEVSSESQQAPQEEEISAEQEDAPKASENISEQDAAAHIVEAPQRESGELAGCGGRNLKRLFHNIETDDLILIGLIIILLLEDGEDIPLILILATILLSELFSQ